MNTEWHASDQMLIEYFNVRCDISTAYSVEAHLECCQGCRGTLARLSESRLEHTEEIWNRIADVIDRPNPPVLARCLIRFGMPEPWALLTSATRAMSATWVGLQIALIAAAVALARLGAGPNAFVPFLFLAPILPALGVVVAYHSRFDPAAEITACTPMAGVRLALTRIVAVLSVTFSLLFAGSLIVGHGWMTLTWILPTLAIAGATLAVVTVLGAERGATVVVALWVTTWFTLYVLQFAPGRFLSLVNDGFLGERQWLWAGVCLVMGAVVYFRRDRFELALELQREGMS